MTKGLCLLVLLPHLSLAADPLPTSEVRSWGYQLTHIDPEEIATSPFDLVVIDYSADGSDATAFSRDDVRKMQRKADGKRRIVLAYMSIGEAENYRFYWNPIWNREPPSWLDKPNPDWPDNYKVRYWQKGWQRTIMGSGDAYLDKILAAGFDGVWLDIIDAFEFYEAGRPAAPDEMVAFVQAIRRYARRRQPTFLVFGQNGESLVDRPGYLEAIDGIGKEDLYFGQEHEETRSPEAETSESIAYLSKARGAGKRILTVDYVRRKEQVDEVLRRARKAGFVPTTGVRDLDRLVDPRDAATALRPPDTSAGKAKGSLQTPGRFFAVTIPRHAILGRVGFGRFHQRTSFEERDVSGTVTYAEEGDLTDWRSFVAASYGITDFLELGLEVPITRTTARSHVVIGDPEKLPDAEDSGLSSVLFSALTGRSFRNGSDNLLLELDIGLPTDRRSKDVRAEGSGSLSLEGEHYFDRIGLLGTVAFNYEGRNGFSNADTSISYLAGLGLEATDSLLFSVKAGQDDRITVGEAAAEAVVADGISIELIVTADLEGFADTTEYTLTLNKLWR